MKLVSLVVLVVVFLGIGGFDRVVEGAGECGSCTNPEEEALMLTPCASPARDDKAAGSDTCCAQMKKFVHNPSRLCAVALSNAAKTCGIKPEIAITC